MPVTGSSAFPGKGHTADEELRQLQRENQRLKETAEILKKRWVSRTCRSDRAPEVRKPLLERYPFIEEHRNEYSPERLCGALDVSVSSFYSWKKRPESNRKQENQRIVEEIKVIHQQSRETYGSPRIRVDLQEKGRICPENRVARLMKNHRIAAGRR